MGTITAVALCRRTIELGWTLPVRKLYLERASMAMQNLLPLAIPSPMAAARLTALQGLLAKLVLYGKGVPYVQRPHEATDTNHAPRPWMGTIMGHGKRACYNVIPVNEEPAAAPTAHAMGKTGTSAPENFGGVRQVNAHQFRHT